MLGTRLLGISVLTANFLGSSPDDVCTATRIFDSALIPHALMHGEYGTWLDSEVRDVHLATFTAWEDDKVRQAWFRLLMSGHGEAKSIPLSDRF
jgi:hypothetical protein